MSRLTTIRNKRKGAGTATISGIELMAFKKSNPRVWTASLLLGECWQMEIRSPNI